MRPELCRRLLRWLRRRVAESLLERRFAVLLAAGPAAHLLSWWAWQSASLADEERLNEEEDGDEEELSDWLLCPKRLLGSLAEGTKLCASRVNSSG